MNALIAAELNNEKNEGAGLNALTVVAEEIGLGLCMSIIPILDQDELSSTKTSSLKGCVWFVRASLFDSDMTRGWHE